MLHNSQKDFLKRHIGPSEEDQLKILSSLGFKVKENKSILEIEIPTFRQI